MTKEPKHADGQFLKYGVRSLTRLGIMREVYELLDVAPIAMVPIRRTQARRGVIFAKRGFAWLVRAALFVNDHKWDLDEWLCMHTGLMWIDDGDYYRNAMWRFPWRHLPSLPCMLKTGDLSAFEARKAQVRARAWELEQRARYG